MSEFEVTNNLFWGEKFREIVNIHFSLQIFFTKSKEKYLKYFFDSIPDNF